MVTQTSTDEEPPPRLIYNIKLSSVGPGNVTGQDVEYHPTDMDLAMKLHYLRLVYFFPAESVTGLTVRDFKESSFIWLNYYYESCGRFRRDSAPAPGRPYVKCNDCGIRFVEAKSDFTLQQWIDMVKVDLPSCDGESHRLLVPNQVLGPELTFSPQVLLQLTFLKCGGISLGMSWAHVLGDAYSATKFINVWAKFLSGIKPTHSPNLSKPSTTSNHIKGSTSPKSTLGPYPLSVKTTTHPVGDNWVVPTTPKTETLSFRLTSSKLAHIQTTGRVSAFDAICAVMWKSIAKTRDVREEPKRVTVVRSSSDDDEMIRKRSGMDLLGNTQVVGVVEVVETVREADPVYLAGVVKDGGVDERFRIEEMVGKEAGMVDLVVYGANLTFVDYMEENKVDWYGFELRGKKPVFVNCFLDGVGEEGLVVVMPGKEEGDELLVHVTLPENETGKLKQVLAEEWCIGGV